MKRIIVLASILVFLCCSTATAQPFSDWSKQDYARQIALSVFHTADWLQTRDIATNPDYRENNPVLGNNPSLSKVNLYFGTTLFGSWIVADALPLEWRKGFQYIYVGVEASCVSSNFNAGVKFNF